MLKICQIKCSLFLLIFSLLLSSCGTLFSGTLENVTIKSNPSEALVFVNDIYMGITPTIIRLKLDSDYKIVLSKPLYQDASLTLKRSFNKTALLNTIIIPGWIIDMITGGLWHFDQKTMEATLLNGSKKEIN